MSSVEETPSQPASPAADNTGAVESGIDTEVAEDAPMKKQPVPKKKAKPAAADAENENDDEQPVSDDEPIVKKTEPAAKSSAKTPATKPSAASLTKAKAKSAASAKAKMGKPTKSVKNAAAKGKATAGGKPLTTPKKGDKATTASVMKKPGMNMKRPAAFGGEDPEDTDDEVKSTKPSQKKKNTGKPVTAPAVQHKAVSKNKVVRADIIDDDDDDDDDDDEEDDEGEEKDEDETERDECDATTDVSVDKLDRSKANKFNDMYKDGQLPDWARAYYDTCMHIFVETHHALLYLSTLSEHPPHTCLNKPTT